jgi:arylsulfatase A-like enzyme
VSQLVAPHILFVILDDLGSNDLGFHNNNDILTPTINQLIQSGTYLSNYYVLPYCSPTRAAILTGRYPLHTGSHTIIEWDQSQGLDLSEETLPQILRRGHDGGKSTYYQTHAVGKWHLGHAKFEQTPTFRGFQSFYGYYLGSGDYYTHYHGPEAQSTGYGYDFRSDENEFCGANCSKIINVRGEYSTHLFTKQAIRIIQNYHSKQQEQQRLFLYLAHQAVHAPNEVPDKYTKLYENKTGIHWTEQRKIYAGMLTAADESIANVTQALKDNGMWNNTIVIVTTDNGGPTAVCGVQGSTNRKTTRGGKCTVWEGGTTGDALISGPAWKYIRDHYRRQHDNQHVVGDAQESDNEVHYYANIFHAVDWLPTLVALTGTKPNGKPLDGVDHLDALLTPANLVPPPREEVFVGYAQFENRWYGPAVRWQKWKLLQGVSGGPESRSGPFPPGPSQPAAGGDVNYTYQLFDLEVDPGETTNLAGEYPILEQILQGKLKEYQKTYVPPFTDYPECTPFRGIVNTSEFGPTFVPWCSQLVVYT